MKVALRRLAAVGLVATVVDVALLFFLVEGAGWPAVAADAVAIAVAAAVSFVLHRRFTSRDDPQRRFVDAALLYLAVTAAAGVLDVAVLSVVRAALEPMSDTSSLLMAKGAALAVAGSARLTGYRRVLLKSVRADQSLRVERGPAPGSCRFTVVIPAYRSTSSIGDAIAGIRHGLADIGVAGGLEIIVVDDGSNDDTADAAGAAGADQVIRFDSNRGKGAAVRAGCLAASGRAVAFTDDDLSYGASDLRRVLDGVEAGWDVVVGSRKHIDTTTLVRARRLREVTGRLFNLLTTAVLLGQYRDTQCGLKGFRSDVARLLFEHGRIERFAFDVELFYLAERYRLSLLEIPVELSSAAGSRVRLGRDSWLMITDLFRIRRLARLAAYDPDPAARRQWLDARRTMPS